MSIRDNEQRYGRVSRMLHWGMALLIGWQFLSAGAHSLFDDTAIEAFFWPTHKPVGFLLLVLVVLRIAWALANRGNRPPSVSAPARLGHIALYALVFVTPLLALLRQYGSGRAFEPFGMPLFSGWEEDMEIAWMIEPANFLHGWFGWALLALILGHSVMTYWHRRTPGQPDVLPRMWR